MNTYRLKAQPQITAHAWQFQVGVADDDKPGWVMDGVRKAFAEVGSLWFQENHPDGPRVQVRAPDGGIDDVKPGDWFVCFESGDLAWYSPAAFESIWEAAEPVSVTVTDLPADMKLHADHHTETIVPLEDEQRRIGTITTIVDAHSNTVTASDGATAPSAPPDPAARG